jgi:hypothetical protein
LVEAGTVAVSLLSKWFLENCDLREFRSVLSPLFNRFQIHLATMDDRSGGYYGNGQIYIDPEDIALIRQTLLAAYPDAKVSESDIAQLIVGHESGHAFHHDEAWR